MHLADGSIIVYERTPRDHEEARSRICEGIEEDHGCHVGSAGCYDVLLAGERVAGVDSGDDAQLIGLSGTKPGSLLVTGSRFPRPKTST